MSSNNSYSPKFKTFSISKLVCHPRSSQKVLSHGAERAQKTPTYCKLSSLPLLDQSFPNLEKKKKERRVLAMD